MTSAQIAHIMALVKELCVAERAHHTYAQNLWRELEAALRDAPQQAEPKGNSK